MKWNGMFNNKWNCDLLKLKEISIRKFRDLRNASVGCI